MKIRIKQHREKAKGIGKGKKNRKKKKNETYIPLTTTQIRKTTYVGISGKKNVKRVRGPWPGQALMWAAPSQ